MLGTALTPTADNDTVQTAEQILQRHHTDDGALGLLTAPCWRCSGPAGRTGPRSGATCCSTGRWFSTRRAGGR
ncbi:hypothetical protein V2I01_31455 [Micromonospora sp. BRA006-A]|nr:hypothetical protein [Micromonospora sp. BRA006-A]